MHKLPFQYMTSVFFHFYYFFSNVELFVLSLIFSPKSRHDTAVSEREELERELTNLRSNVDDCTISRVDLERKLVSLREELDFDNLAHTEVEICYVKLESQNLCLKT